RKPLVRLDRIRSVVDQHALAIRINHKPFQGGPAAALLIEGPESIQSGLLHVEFEHRICWAASTIILPELQSGKIIERVLPGRCAETIVAIDDHRVGARRWKLQR